MSDKAIVSRHMAAVLLRVALLAGGMGIVAGPALAHAHLRASNPAANAILAASPRTLELSFTEPLEPRFSGVTLQDSAGQAVLLPAAVATGSDPRRLVLDLPSLPGGAFTVLWSVTSIDTHRSEGRFVFTIRQP